MKIAVLTLFTLLSVLSFGQSTNSNDTLYMKDNSVYIGKIANEEWKIYQFIMSGTQKIVSIPKGDVERVGRKEEIRQEIKEVSRFDTLSFESLRLEVKEIKLQFLITKEHLKIAGQCGIAGGAVSIGGAILSVVGAFTGKPILTYTGAGLAGSGLILNFVAFGNLIKAGKTTKRNTQ